MSEIEEAKRAANGATRRAEPEYPSPTAYALLLELRALRLTIEQAADDFLKGPSQ